MQNMAKPYTLGYRAEHLCRKKLQRRGAIVVRSAASKGLADLLAIFPKEKEIWLIQVKRKEMPKDESKLKERFIELSKLKGEYKVKTLLFLRRKGRYEFIEV
jgi:Holliday junction resolvase